MIVFSDTIFASTDSKRGNKFVQVYSTDFEWARVNLVATRDKVLMLFARDVFCHHVYAIIPEVIQDKFYHKLKDATCQLKQLRLDQNHGKVVSCYGQEHLSACEMTV